MTPTQKTAERIHTDRRAVHREMLAIVKNSKNKLTPRELEKKLSGRLLIDKKNSVFLITATFGIRPSSD